MPLAATARDLAQAALYLAAPAAYRALARRLRTQGLPPWLPFLNDHFLAVLQKVSQC